MVNRHLWTRPGVLLLVATLFATACSGGGAPTSQGGAAPTQPSAAPTQASAAPTQPSAAPTAATAAAVGGNPNLKGEISVAYSATYVFDNDPDAVAWWNNIKQEFESKYPGATLKLIGIDGTDIDMMNKVALMYKSPSTTPDVLQLPTTFVGQYAASDYLLPLDDYLAKDAPFWNDFPKNIQDESRINGKVYAVNSGENDSGIYYNKEMLTKAGIQLPWKPKNWDEILDAARKVKQANPNVVPLWAAAGTSAGPTGILQGSGNLIYGSSTPIMLDDKTGKWVVKSPGLIEVLQFYKTVYSEGLGASTSDLFSPKAVGRPVVLMKDKQLAIAIGSNWYAAAWREPNRHWENAQDEAAATPIPTSKGQAPGVASTLGGWAYAISKSTKNPDLAWALIKVLEEDANSIKIATGSGFVPPSQKAGKAPDFVNYAPPFNAQFNEILPFAKPLPYDGNFPVYARALGDATGQIAQNPSMSIDDALKIIRDTMVNQLGEDKVEELQ